LNPKGIFVVVGGSRATIFQVVLLGASVSMTGSKKMGMNTWKTNKKRRFGLSTRAF